MKKAVKKEYVIIGQAYVRNNKIVVVVFDYVKDAVLNRTFMKTKKPILKSVVHGKFVCFPWAQEAKPGDVVSVLDLDENDKETIRREIQKEVEMHLAELERLKVIL